MCIESHTHWSCTSLVSLRHVRIVLRQLNTSNFVLCYARFAGLCSGFGLGQNVDIEFVIKVKYSNLYD